MSRFSDDDPASEFLRRKLREKLEGKMAERTELATGQGLIAVAVDGSNAAKRVLFRVARNAVNPGPALGCHG